MPTRRSHQKSRKGCLTCKRRHVKCDEEGPPCGRCKVRGTVCEYTEVTSSSSPQSSFPTASETDPNTASSPESNDGLVFPADQRRLELQLMHRWSTVTYKSCCTPGSGDDEVWKFMVPKWALQYEFFLNGLFALTAFDISRLSKESDYPQYVNAAIEYHALSLGGFRSRLPTILHTDHEVALCFSLVLMVLAFASAQFTSDPATKGQGNMLQNAISHFELLRGCIPIAESKEGYLAENPYIQKMVLFKDLPRARLDGLTEAALAKLSDFNDKRIMSSMRESDERRLQQVTYWEACKKALGFLRECFEKCDDSVYRGYTLGWLNMAGDEYIRALKAGDHVALLMLMYWGVLIERNGNQVWWTSKFGKLLVDEISHQILEEDMDTNMKELILRAQELIQSEAVI